MQTEASLAPMVVAPERRWDAMVWTDRYCIGHPDIDADHRRLFELFNDFNSAVNDDRGERIMRTILEDLKDYTVHHFRREEALMVGSAYPDRIRHQRMHATFERQIDDVASHLEVSGDLGAFLLSFLSRWLANHILTVDQQLAQHLVAQGSS